MATNLSVCLLVYNHAHILNEVIISILDQTISDFEFIISDDCSTDDSYVIAKSFEKIDKRTFVIKTPKNLGMAGNANYAISQAKGDYIALLHHDDILHKQTFEYWLECINSDENIAFVFNDYKTEILPSTNYYLDNRLKPINNGRSFLKNILLKQWGCPVRGTALIRKKYFDKVGGMNEKFGMLADVDLWMQLASKYDIGYVNLPLIKVLAIRPENYPKDYTRFSWKRLFLLFDLHLSNINRNNYPNYLRHKIKRLIFRNKASFEIIKWYLYASYKNSKYIFTSYPVTGKTIELFYVRPVHMIIGFYFKVRHGSDVD